MDPQYRCANENRRRRVVDSPLNGVDFLEVLDHGAEVLGLPRQQVLRVVFLKDLPADGAPDALDASNVVLEAEPRAATAGVVWARRASDVDTDLVGDPETGAPLTLAQRNALRDADGADQTLVVMTDGTGDFSTYRLRLITSPTDDAPPDGIDQRLAVVAFSFKVECPSDFDCAPVDDCPPEAFDAPAIDYLAKDYASFRRLMLDRMSVLVPSWRDRSPADLGVVLVEVLAYAADHLSYAQDAVATEATLATARRRASVRRHARLLDYAMHDGVTARAWVHLVAEPGAPVTVAAGTAVRTAGARPLVFETMHEVEARSAHNEIRFYTWGDTECCLPAGATRATLLDAPAGSLALAPDDVLILEEVRSPTTGLPFDADRAHRHAVRLTTVEPDVDALDTTAVVEVAWHEADALPFPLCLSAVLDGAALDDLSVVRGNVALADHGETRVAELIPAIVPEGGRYRPRLEDDGLTFAAPFDLDAARALPAARALAQDPRAALPDATLNDGDEDWHPQRDLLGSGRFTPEFVAEVAVDGETTLRFGDGVLGKLPAAGSTFTATYRVGSGVAGNVGADVLTEVDVAGLSGARNPLPAVGGTEPESIEEVRQYAPQAFRTQERAVTAADYAEVTERHPDVQKAAAVFRWTGSWMTVFVTVDRRGGLPVRNDPVFLPEILAHIDRYRLAGYDLEVRDPLFVPLDLALTVCVAPGYFRSDIRQSLRVALGRQERADGTRGFFHPDRFTFGQPVYLSQIYRAAMAVDGVASVEVRRFQRYGEAAHGEIDAGVLATAGLEIARLDNDPSRPGNGRLELDISGGI